MADSTCFYSKRIENVDTKSRKEIVLNLKNPTFQKVEMTRKARSGARNKLEARRLESVTVIGVNRAENSPSDVRGDGEGRSHKFLLLHG